MSDKKLIEKQIEEAAECLLAADKALGTAPNNYRLQVNDCLGRLLQIVQTQQRQIEELQKGQREKREFDDAIGALEFCERQASCYLPVGHEGDCRLLPTTNQEFKSLPDDERNRVYSRELKDAQARHERVRRIEPVDLCECGHTLALHGERQCYGVKCKCRQFRLEAKR